MALEFTEEAARRELHRNGAMNRPCPACDKTHWKVAPLLTGMLAITDDTLNFDDTMATRTVTVVCLECGFLRLHDWRVLSD